MHLWVLCQQHVLNPRLAVIQRAVPRHVVPAAEGVLCGTDMSVGGLASAEKPRLGSTPIFQKKHLLIQEERLWLFPPKPNVCLFANSASL